MRIQRHPALQAILEDEREMVIDTAEMRLADAIENGDPWALQFYLKTIGRSRGYVEVTKVDIEVRIRERATALGMDPDEAVKEAQALIEDWKRAARR